MLTLGSAGPEVASLHQSLIESGEAVDGGDLAAHTFGPSTLAAVKAYQQAHGLAPDGVCGPRTLAALSGGASERFTAAGWRCSPTEAPARLVDALRWAVGRIGTVEQPPGSNRGPEIDVWNAGAGIPPGSPWCAAFATKALSLADGPPPIPRFGSAYKIREWGTASGKLVPAGAALAPADVGVIMRDASHGHVVLVATALDADRIATVEGNAGNAVRGLVRPRSAFACFVRPL